MQQLMWNSRELWRVSGKSQVQNVTYYIIHWYNILKQQKSRNEEYVISCQGLRMGWVCIVSKGQYEGLFSVVLDCGSGYTNLCTE